MVMDYTTNPQIDTACNHHPGHDVKRDQHQPAPLHPCLVTPKEIAVWLLAPHVHGACCCVSRAIRTPGSGFPYSNTVRFSHGAGSCGLSVLRAAVNIIYHTSVHIHSCQFTTHHVISHHTDHATPCRVISGHTVSCHATSRHVKPCHMPHPVVSYVWIYSEGLT